MIGITEKKVHRIGTVKTQYKDEGNRRIKRKLLYARQKKDMEKVFKVIVTQACRV